jgi:hypothetical protein
MKEVRLLALSTDRLYHPGGVFQIARQLAHESGKVLALSTGRLYPQGDLSRFQDSRHMKVGRLLALSTGRLYPQKEFSRFQDNRHMKVVKLLVLSTGRLYPLWIFLVLISVRPWVDWKAIRAAGRMSVKNSNNTIRNRNCDLPVCSAMFQPNAQPLAPIFAVADFNLKSY